jgi:hypothetical protein
VVQDFQLDNRLDVRVIKDSMVVIESGKGQVKLAYDITNEMRTFGATLSYEVSFVIISINDKCFRSRVVTTSKAFPTTASRLS